MKLYYSAVRNFYLLLPKGRCVHFVPQPHSNKGLYSCSDKEEMLLIEQSREFKKGFIYLGKGVELEPEPEKLLQVEGVSRLQDAIQYLKDYCAENAIEYKKVSNSFQAKAYAKKLGFEFPNLP